MSRTIINLKNFEDSLHSFNNKNGPVGRRRNSLIIAANAIINFGGDSRRAIGWKTISETELTVSQSSAILFCYIRHRLKRSGIFHRKLGLKRITLPDVTIVNDVCPVLIAVTTELEKEHPSLYIKIGRQVGCGCFSDHSVANTMLQVSREIIRHGEITWSKIIAIYAVAGGIGVDCVRQGKPEFLSIIQNQFKTIVEKDLALWIQASGGWSTFMSRYRLTPKTSEWNSKKLSVYLSIVISIVIILWLLL